MSIPSSINLGNIIPSSKARGAIYAAFGLIGLGIGATQVGFSAALVDQPVWLTVATAVYGFLGAAGFAVATANTPVTTPPADIPGD